MCGSLIPFVKEMNLASGFDPVKLHGVQLFLISESKYTANTGFFPFLKSALAFVAFCFISLSQNLAAHEVRPAIVNLYLNAGGYELHIDLNLEALLAGIDPQHSDTAESGNADEYDRLRRLSSLELRDELMGRQTSFLAGIRVQDQLGYVIPHRLKKVEIPEVGDLETSRISKVMLVPEFDRDTEAITWWWTEEFGPSVVRVNDPNLSQDQDGYSAFLETASRSAEIPLSTSSAANIYDVMWNYLIVGFSHIVPKGIDHILFVIGLFLLSPTFKPLIVQVTSFTVAHTVTLALATLGVMQISPAIVEPLIAASIVYVAVENIFSEKLRIWRPPVVFGFGLIHGLGFAGVLSEIGLNTSYLLPALIAFNIGVEIGQLVILSGCFLLVGLWFRNKPWYRKIITIPVSLLIAFAGVFWLIDRLPV